MTYGLQPYSEFQDAGGACWCSVCGSTEAPWSCRVMARWEILYRGGPVYSLNPTFPNFRSSQMCIVPMPHQPAATLTPEPLAGVASV